MENTSCTYTVLCILMNIVPGVLCSPEVGQPRSGHLFSTWLTSFCKQFFLSFSLNMETYFTFYIQWLIDVMYKYHNNIIALSVRTLFTFNFITTVRPKSLEPSYIIVICIKNGSRILGNIRSLSRSTLFSIDTLEVVTAVYFTKLWK